MPGRATFGEQFVSPKFKYSCQRMETVRCLADTRLSALRTKVPIDTETNGKIWSYVPTSFSTQIPKTLIYIFLIYCGTPRRLVHFETRVRLINSPSDLNANASSKTIIWVWKAAQYSVSFG